MMITDDNYMNFAMRHYDNPQCKTLLTFNDDLNKVVHIKRLINRIALDEDINLRLVLNHLITFFNVFDHDAAIAILFYKIEKNKWNILKTFLEYLNYLPPEVLYFSIDIFSIETVSSIKAELEII